MNIEKRGEISAILLLAQRQRDLKFKSYVFDNIEIEQTMVKIF